MADGRTEHLKILFQARQKGRLPHALLFAGPSGVGKKKTALNLAQILVCRKSCPELNSSCQCVECLKISQEESTANFLRIEPRSLIIKIESIRSILKFLALETEALARVVMITGAHQMNPQASSALLKILEEPPQKTYFLLISSHAYSLPATIRSRLQVLNFSPLSLEDIKKECPADTPDWVLKASAGRADEIEKWRENENIRRFACLFLKRALGQDELCSFAEMGEFKEREQALFICLFLQQLVRDARGLQLGFKDCIHEDQKDLLSRLKEVKTEVLHKIFKELIFAERDLKRYINSVLIFELLFFSIRNFMHSQKKALS